MEVPADRRSLRGCSRSARCSATWRRVGAVATHRSCHHCAGEFSSGKAPSFQRSVSAVNFLRFASCVRRRGRPADLCQPLHQPLSDLLKSFGFGWRDRCPNGVSYLIPDRTKLSQRHCLPSRCTGADGRSWPEAERLVWGVQRQQAGVRSLGLPTASVDPKRR
jgi:hypothetical protein